MFKIMLLSIYTQDTNSIENIQRRATKLIPEIKDLSYTERLKALNLTTLALKGKRRYDRGIQSSKWLI